MSCSLTLLRDYSSESDGENVSISNSKKQKLSDDITVARLPVPKLLSKESKEADSLEWLDNSEKHQGRTRSFAHERGNWASYVYIPFDDIDSELLDDFIDALSPIEVFHTIEDFHISFSKTFVLKFHWISTIKESFQEILRNTQRTDIILDTVAVYSNEERSRTFIGLRASDISSEFLNEIVGKVDKILSEFNLPPFYKDPSFHVSILWCLGDKVKEVTALLQTLQKQFDNFVADNSEPRTAVDNICFKTGNKSFNFALLK